MRSLIFIDFEVFKKDWLMVAVNIMNGEEVVIENDPDKLYKYYDAHKDDIFVGYNIRDYDQWIFKYILVGGNPYFMSDFIVNDKQKGHTFSSELKYFPLIIYDTKVAFQGLKSLEAFQGHNIHETSVPFDLDRKLTREELDETIKYCKNDVYETINVFKLTKQEFDAQLSLVKNFNLPLIDLGRTQAQLSSKILEARQRRRKDEWDLRLPTNLRLCDYSKVGEWFLNEENHNYSAKLEIDIYGVPHVFGYGGLHGARKKYIRNAEADEIFVMADVDQLYPTLMIEYGLLSRNVKDVTKFQNILETSLKLKREGKKKEREPYKRICNITYGAEGDKYNPMYDPLHRNLVCVFGQVFLLDLIEKLKNFELVQSNTDGILYLVKLDRLEEFKRICNEWSARTKLKLSYDEYTRVCQKDVNNYVLVNQRGNMKCKGAYVKNLSDIDNDLPIVNEAVKNYLAYGTPIHETIYREQELVKFQKIYKLSNKYKEVWHNDIFYVDKVYRTFASTNFGDTFLGKRKEGGKVERFANSPNHCFINNDNIVGEKTPHYLDRNWYYRIACKRVSEFGVPIEEVDILRYC